MARAKKCQEEFNPWPPFVDVFSSVILVLLLFILVTIVNVAYYMQFNSKSEAEVAKASKVDSFTKGKDVTEMITLKKEKKVALDSKGSDSLFSGGNSEGNAMTLSQKESKIEQGIKKDKEGELLVTYKDKEIFLTKSAKDSIKSFIKAQRAKNKSAKFEISIAQPINIIGKTIPKQISIGRALDAKNAMKKMGVKLSQMRLSIKKTRDKNFGYGYVKIKVIK